jgi:hypothetical protein
MRRVDVIAVGIGIFAAGGLIYIGLRGFGLDSANAGIWSQAIFVGGLVGWLLTYLFRAVTKNMTLNQQLQDYEDAVLQKRLDELTPEQLAALQAELEQERQAEQEAEPTSERSPE